MTAFPKMDVGGAIPKGGASFYLWTHKGAAKGVTKIATEPPLRAMRGKHHRKHLSRLSSR